MSVQAELNKAHRLLSQCIGWQRDAELVKLKQQQEIERLRAEIERLTGNKWSEIEIALSKVRAHEMWKSLHDIDSIDELFADRERLRVALRECIRDLDLAGVPVAARARLALEQSK